MSRRKLLVLSVASILARSASSAEAATGIVLMHGKWGHPNYLSGLVSELRGEGFGVVTPTMPWAGTREYDVPYAVALAEINEAVNSLRSKGAQRVLVGGHSFGANAAFAYAANGRAVDGIVALAPGHVPERGGFKRALEPSVAKAREMMVAGAGTQSAWFSDVNQGQTKQVRAAAQAFFSYFDPEGLGSMPKMAAAMSTPVPIFMAVGSSDPIADYAENAIFNVAPRHEKSRYVAMAADHANILRLSSSLLASWLKNL